MSRWLWASAAALLVFGCQRGRDRAAERIIETAIEAHGREARVDIDRRKGSVVVTLGGALRPAGWPDSIPFYPRARRASLEKRSPRARAVSLLSDDAPAEVVEFYRRELSAAGWELPSGAAPDGEWIARRGGETLRFRVVAEGARGTRADVEYRASS